MILKFRSVYTRGLYLFWDGGSCPNKGCCWLWVVVGFWLLVLHIITTIISILMPIISINNTTISIIESIICSSSISTVSFIRICNCICNMNGINNLYIPITAPPWYLWGCWGYHFYRFWRKYNKSIFYKNSILDITHHLRGATEFSWGQWKSAYSTLYFYWVKPWKTQNLKIWTPLCWPLNLYKRVLGPSKNHETHIDL